MSNRIPEPEEILELAQQLKEAKDRVSDLQAQWASYFTGAELVDSQQATNESARRVGTLVSQMLNLMEGNPDNVYTSSLIASILGAKQNSVGPLLSRLVAENKIVKRGHGEYSAKPRPRDKAHADFDGWGVLLKTDVNTASVS